MLSQVSPASWAINAIWVSVGFEVVVVHAIDKQAVTFYVKVMADEEGQTP